MGPGQPTVLRLSPIHPVPHPGPVGRPNRQSRDRQTLPSARNAQCKQESLLTVVRLVRVSILIIVYIDRVPKIPRKDTSNLKLNDSVYYNISTPFGHVRKFKDQKRSTV